MQPIEYLPDDPGNPGDGGGTPTPPTPTGYGTLVMTVAINKLDASSALDITCYLNCYCQDDLRFSAYVFVDDNLVQVGTTNAIYDKTQSQGQGTMSVVTIVPNVEAGQHTVALRVKNRDPGYPLNVLPGSLMKVAELRQAAR